MSFFLMGCATGSYTHRDPAHHSQGDSHAHGQMTLEDIIALARDSVADAVIIDQMHATASGFRLTTEDILKLKNEGVSEGVIREMIKNGGKTGDTDRYYYGWFYDPYDPWWGSPHSFCYPSVRIGLAHSWNHFRTTVGGARRPSGRRR